MAGDGCRPPQYRDKRGFSKSPHDRSHQDCSAALHPRNCGHDVAALGVMDVIGWSFGGLGPRVSLQDVIGIISLNLMGCCPNPPTPKSNPRGGGARALRLKASLPQT